MSSPFLYGNLHLNVRTTRRTAISSLIGVAGMCVLPSCWARGGAAFADTSGVNEQSVQYKSGSASIEAFMASPKSMGPRPAILLIHPVEGLDEDTKEVARKLAAEGFVVLAPNFASRAKVTPDTEMGKIVMHLSPLQSIMDAKFAYDFLQVNKGVDSSKVSVIGLGWGSWRACMLAQMAPDLHRLIVYYGAIPTEGLERIKAPVMAHFAELDYRDTGNAVWVEQTMKGNGNSFVYTVYGGATDDFMTKGTAAADAEAAKVSWKKTLEFLKSVN